MGANNSTAESTHAQLSSLYLLSTLDVTHVAGSPPAFPCECEFKGHAIIARKGGEPGNEANTELAIYVFLELALLV